MRAHSPDSVGTSSAAEAVMLEPAHIAVEEGAQIVHAIFEHRQPVDAAAEGEALPFVGIEPAIGDHPGMDHAASRAAPSSASVPPSTRRPFSM